MYRERGDKVNGLGNKEILSKNLKYYIDKSGKDRRQLAEAWGVPYSTLTGWINAQKYPRIDKIEIMADYFGIMKADLIEEKLVEGQPVNADGLTESQLTLIDFAKTLSEEQAAKVLQLMKAILAFDE